jgi:antitoxin component YwqK of YwqJK toxin-antitoxin module
MSEEESKDGSEDLCYICYDEGSDLNPFIEKQVCACKGSIKCHQLCLELSKLVKKSKNSFDTKNSFGVCSVCKKYYNVSTFLDETIWQIYEKEMYKIITGFKISNSIVVKHGEYYKLNNTFYGYTINEKGRYYEDLKDGTWEKYYSYTDKLYSIENYNKGKKHGNFITYFENNEIYQSEEYINDKLHGIQYIKLSQKSNIIIRNFFEYGVPKGTHSEVLSNCLEDIKVYNGKYVNGLRYGVWTLYSFQNYKTVKICKRVNYKNGILDGQLLTFHENGKILKEVNYKDGEKHGLRRIFDEKGNLGEYMYFKNGVLDGPFCLFENIYGKIFPFFKGQFKNGIHYGKHFLYEHSKFPTQIYNYNDKGELNGPIYFYSPSGRMVAMFTFRNGVLHGKQISNDTVGLDLRIEFMAKNGLVSGKVRYMNSNKKIEELYVNQITLNDLEEIVDLDLLIKLPSHIDEHGNIIDKYLNNQIPCDYDKCSEKEEEESLYSSYDRRSYYTDSDYDSDYDRRYDRYLDRLCDRQRYRH